MVVAVTDPSGLADEILDDLRRVFARHPAIEEVRLFGSRAKGTHRPGSDIDLAVFAPSMSEAEFAALWQEIDDLSILFKIDLLHWDRLANTVLRDKIRREGRRIYPQGNP
ncbi:nucleotidyltransferase family protein [Tepidiphilus sp. J10]|uniref:nucleotidyltransferase family protein n=1 Tax=Tepidiphilus sp. J10 TaxID=2502185 RepID=UPI00115DFF9D|nr:nucleotidyltransferase domain-containing protein [Tepidiphilus sp. J10]